MMKLAITCVLLIAAAQNAATLTPPTSSPAPGQNYAVLRSEFDIAPDGSNYQYAYETENKISAEETGTLVGSGSDVGPSVFGFYKYISPEGTPVHITYVAGPDGFLPQGDVIPTAPPVPAAILKAIEYSLAHPEPESPKTPVVKPSYGR